tara:strand:+ start:612 stop:1142 length:531 start_codon:yes stop_codon:yes gene_type:complete
MNKEEKMNTAADTRSAPWYRQRWPWILMVAPVTAMVLGFVLLYLAITTNDGLVVDDYYRQGRAIDQTMARSAQAAELGLVADVRLRAGEIRLRLSADDGVELPRVIVVSVVHPTRAGFDQVLRLEAGHGGEYAGPLAPLTAGRWQVQIEDDARAWRLHGDVQIPDGATVRILPYEV